MNAKQTAQFVSYVTTLGTLKNTAETSGIADMPATISDLDTRIAEINLTAKTQTEPIGGQTGLRDNIVAVMVDLALEVANSVALHAEENELPDVLALVNVTRGDFERLRLSHRSWLAQRIHDAGAATLPALPELGALQNAIAAMVAHLSQPRQTIAAKAAATKRLAVLFEEAEKIVHRMDRLIFPLRKSSPQFYAEYQHARMAIVLPGGRSPDAATPAEGPAGAQPVAIDGDASAAGGTVVKLAA